MTKLEEIALAIHRARYPDAPVMDSIDCLGPTVEERALIEARAAVEVIKGPTEQMLDAAYYAPGCGFDYDTTAEEHKIEVRNAFNAMIDAILNEKPVIPGKIRSGGIGTIGLVILVAYLASVGLFFLWAFR